MENPAYKTALGLLIKSLQEGSVKNHQIPLPIGPTPQVLLDIGMPPLQLAVLGKVIDKVVFDHGIPKGTLERLYKILEAPKAIFKGHLDNPGAAVLTYEVKNSDPIIIAVHPNKQVGGRDGGARFNLVASVYAKSTRPGETLEARWTREGLLLWKAPSIHTAGTQAPILKVVRGQ
ncbi:MuF-C-terminal domain-containing protein [Pseudoduganella buxea]|uniref:Phage MuF C-terminal domain-containing protein n=1 Tax=Pseudoduganella buxea TaxID=1949069 RepID=A0A6I3SR99_9BURK|nr:hypothetical protein [Pseudoduganella buxea]MTV51618.1 hypothetical protein [Pseudoduganella buxea]GGC04658.1 hypothetical protein GCM10011572_28130 [Pseudoduganella buxea]